MCLLEATSAWRFTNMLHAFVTRSYIYFVIYNIAIVCAFGVGSKRAHLSTVPMSLGSLKDPFKHTLLQCWVAHLNAGLVSYFPLL